MRLSCWSRRLEGQASFTVRKPFSRGENISFKGEDAKEGERLIEAGAFIHPGTIALLATFGYAEVKVAKRPVVGILSTGTELLEVSDEACPRKNSELQRADDCCAINPNGNWLQIIRDAGR